jgi:hypothetical protein
VIAAVYLLIVHGFIHPRIQGRLCLSKRSTCIMCQYADSEWSRVVEMNRTDSMLTNTVGRVYIAVLHV